MLSSFKTKHHQHDMHCQIFSVPLRGLKWEKRSSVGFSEIHMEKLVTGTWWTWRNNKKATAIESLCMDWCTVWFIVGHLSCSSHACVLYLAHAMIQPATAWTASFLDETTQKVCPRSASCAIKTVKEIAVPGSRGPDKNWSKVKPPKRVVWTVVPFVSLKGFLQWVHTACYFIHHLNSEIELAQ